MKQLNITFLLTMLMSMIGIQAFGQDFGVANADGVTIYYNYINDSTELAVTHRGSEYNSYSNEYSGNVVIPETVTYNDKTYSVTSIGEYAFWKCTGLTAVTIPNSVTSIGEYAFSYCPGLTEVTIGNSVTSIGIDAFWGCTGLTEVTIPNSVTSIGEKAFEGCTGLTEVTIPNSVTSIGDYAFFLCTGLTSVAIPNSVTSIGGCAFEGCTGLTEVTIPNSVTSIGGEAFNGCTGLTSIEVESGNTKYDSRDNCNAIIKTSTNTLVLGCKNTIIPNSVTSIGGGAFYGCTRLTSVTIPNSVTSIGEFAFKDCTGLTSVTIPNSVTSIGTCAFEKCTGLPSVTIPNSVTSIGSSAFNGCTGLTSVTIPNSVTSIESSAFNGCTGLTSIEVESGNTEYDSRDNCNAIIKTSTNTLVCGCKNTIIPNSVTSIGNDAFRGCTGLTEVTIPNSVTSIGWYAFSHCSGLTEVTIPNSVTSIGRYAFSNCTGLTSIEVESGNTKYDSRDNCNAIIETSTNTLVCGCKNTIIPNSVTSIGGSAFSGCTGLTSVTIPNSVTSIGYGAFGGCTGLTEVTIPNSVTSIGGEAFNGCTGLTSITIPNSVTSIGDGAFSGCTGLTSITIPNSVTSIGDGAFLECTGLTSVTIPNSVTSIGESAFYHCTELTSVTIPNSVTSIGIWAFSGCTGLTEVNIPNSVTSIGNFAFRGCTGLTSITIPNSVTSIGYKAFSRCSGLTSVTVGWTTPVSIKEETFNYHRSATLYVPQGTKAAYQEADYWKEFKEIIELSSFGEPTDNTLQLTGAEAYKGKQVQLPVALNNKHEITAFQFDLYLPNGVSVAKKSNGKMMIETTERMEGTYSISSNTINNFVRVTGYSAEGDAFTGNSGDILNITLDISDAVTDGDYTISIKDIVLSDVNNTEYHPANAEGTLTVKSYTLGDVDNSGAVNINDVVCIINHILNKPVSEFIEEAADVDGSGSININDVVTLINRFILMKTGAPALMESQAPQLAIADDNYLHMATIDIKPGETLEIPMLMTNANTVAAIQGNIKLPEGLTFVTKSNGRLDVKNNNSRAEDFTLSCGLQSDGSLTFAQYSADGFTYEGSEGTIFTFKIQAAADVTPGTYNIVLSNVVLSIDGVGYEYPESTSILNITGTVGISNIMGISEHETYHTLDGREVKNPGKGIYIVNGKKVMVK